MGLKKRERERAGRASACEGGLQLRLTFTWKKDNEDIQQTMQLEATAWLHSLYLNLALFVRLYLSLAPSLIKLSVISLVE